SDTTCHVAITLSQQNQLSRVRSGTTHRRSPDLAQLEGFSSLRERTPPDEAGAPHPAYHHPMPPWLIHSRWVLMSPHQTGLA
ncbi:unnamed protein product, partial [Musa textilis]